MTVDWTAVAVRFAVFLLFVVVILIPGGLRAGVAMVADET
jgi:hypothetical protein